MENEFSPFVPSTRLFGKKTLGNVPLDINLTDRIAYILLEGSGNFCGAFKRVT